MWRCKCVGTKQIDPALCMYIGAHLICIDNKYLKDKVPQGTGIMCRVIGVKLPKIPITYKWTNYYRNKVWTVNASDVEGWNVNISTKLEQLCN